MKTTIELTDTPIMMIAKVAEGNPGAASALGQLMSVAEQVDPQAFLGPLGVLMYLGDLGITGPRVWVLFKDQCNHDPRMVLVLLRAKQLGFLSKEDLCQCCVDAPERVQIPDDRIAELDGMVCERLDQFQKSEKQRGQA